MISNYVRSGGRINAVGAKIPIKSNWNLRLLEKLCESASDREVLAFLRYGWPINRDDSPLPQTFDNHSSAKRYSQQVTDYLWKELRHNTLMGPFVTSPFPEKETLSTRPKRGSQKRRIIKDLSWSLNNHSVNSGILKDKYMHVPCKLRYPTIDDLCRRAANLKLQGVEDIWVEERHGESLQTGSTLSLIMASPRDLVGGHTVL